MYPNKRVFMDIENRLVVPKGEGVGGGMEWKVGVSRFKLLNIEYINNKVLPYSTGNHIQYPIINHMEKTILKTCMCVYLNHFAVKQKVNNIVNQCKMNK